MQRLQDGIFFAAKDARLGWDFERDVVANMYDSSVTGHRDADIRYGADVVADLEGVKAASVYDKVRRENPLLPNTGVQELDMAINTTEENLQQEQNFRRLKSLLRVMAGRF